MSTLFTLTDVEESPNPDACTLCGWPDHGPKQLGRGLPWGTAAWSIVWTCFRWRKEDAICPLPLTVPLSVSGLYLLRIRKVCKNLHSHICLKLRVLRMHLYICFIALNNSLCSFFQWMNASHFQVIGLLLLHCQITINVFKIFIHLSNTII